MTDKYKGLRDALDAGPTPGSWAVEIMSSGRTTVTAGQFFVAGADSGAGISDENAAFIAAAYPETIRGLLAERDALREALRWTAATLQDTTSSLELVFDEDLITLEGETKTVAQILDTADAALLAQHQGEKHD